jgi:hypothetical protein
MSYEVDSATGGPYTHEIDAIRDERHRAAVMNTAPDFNNVFEGATISTGAAALIKDIDTPMDAPTGTFIQNVIFHDEEEATPETGTEESAPEADKAESGTNAPVESAPEQSVGEVTPETTPPVDMPAPVVELAAVIDPVTDTPLFDSVVNQDGAV